MKQGWTRQAGTRLMFVECKYSWDLYGLLLGSSPSVWVSLVTQMAKNLPAMQETWFQLMGWEDPLEKGFLPGEPHGQRSLWAMVHEAAKSRTRLSN